MSRRSRSCRGSAAAIETTADAPGMNLSFATSPTPDRRHQGSDDRSHRIRDQESESILREARSARVKFDIPYREVPASASRSPTSPIRQRLYRADRRLRSVLTLQKCHCVPSEMIRDCRTAVGVLRPDPKDVDVAVTGRLFSALNRSTWTSTFPEPPNRNLRAMRTSS